MKTLIRWMGLLCLAALLAGCAASPSSQNANRDWVTDSDEPESRKRARIRLELATGYFEQGQTRVALDEVKQAINADPTFAAAYSLRGLIFLRLNDLPLAEESFQQALKIAPRDGDILHNLGWMYCQTQRYREATQAFERALQAPNYLSAART